MKLWAERFYFIVQKFWGRRKFFRRWEDFCVDAVEALGVRAVYKNGVHAAYLGKTKPCLTNATVCRFKTREKAEEFCDYINEIFEIR